MLTIDGGYLEAGGQILRSAVALAAVKKVPCKIINIRKGRSNPGLATQHLLALRALAELCSGKLEGDFLNSAEIKFYPGEITKEKISLSIPTAASIALILQCLLPAALFSPKLIQINFQGGATDTFFSPTMNHFRYVFLKILEMMDSKVEINILRRGYYPEGGAKVEAKVCPSKLKGLNLTKRGNLQKILVISGAANVLKEKKVAERQIAGAREVLGKLKLPIEEKIEYSDSSCPGSFISLIAQFENTTIGVDNLGRIGKPAETVGREAAIQLLQEQKSGACLDKHLADQILPCLALSAGKSQVTVSEITNHCRTNIWVIEKFLPGKFEVKDNLISWIPGA